MKIAVVGAMVLCSLGLVPAAAAAQGMTIDQLAGGNANKRLVLEYLDMAFSQGKIGEARAKYFAADMKNHPSEPAAMTRPAGGPPLTLPPGVKVTYEFHEAIAEGDIVVVHSLIRGFGMGQTVVDPMGNKGGKKIGDDVIDIFRVRDGKIVAKSDTVQASDSEDLFVE